MILHVADFYYCDQSAPFRSSGGSASTNSQGEAVSATVFDDDLVIGMYGHRPSTGGAGTITAGTSQTQIAEVEGGTNHDSETSYERASANSSSFDHSYTTDAGAGNDAVSYGVLAAGNGFIDVTSANATGTRIFASATHKSGLFVITTDAAAEGAYEWRVSSNGSSWAGGGGTNWPTSVYVHTDETRVNNWAHKYADILNDGDNLIVALYEDPDATGGLTQQVRIGYSTDSGATWTFNAGLIIPCSDTPNVKLLHYNDLYTAGTPQVPVLVLSDNAYALDIATNTFQDLLPRGMLTGTANEALAAEVAADGALYISKSGGDNLRITFPSQGQRVISNVGPQTKGQHHSDGMVSARQGHTNFIYGADPTWLFIAYGGHAANKNASILAMEYSTGSWHSFYKDSSANQDLTRIIISTEDDGTPRLHAATEGAAASTLFMFEEPLVSAITGVTQSFKTTGYVEWAEDDLADPYTEAAVMRALIDDGGTLGAATTNNYVELKYGTNGAAWETTTLGNFLSSAKFLNFDTTNNRGIAAKTISVRLNLFQDDGDTTTTPQIREFEIQARNRVQVLRGWELGIDLNASAEFQSTEEPGNPQDVLANLATVQGSTTLVGMTLGEYAEAEVEMTSGDWQLDLIEAGDGDGLQLGRLVGKAVIVLEEVI
jgi:hypothetical protein